MEFWRDQGLTKPRIANGAQQSEAINIRKHVLLGVIIPALFTGTELSFQVCDTESGTYVDLYDDQSAQVKVTVAAGRAYTLPAALAAWSWVKIKSNAAEGAARELIITLKG